MKSSHSLMGTALTGGEVFAPEASATSGKGCALRNALFLTKWSCCILLMARPDRTRRQRRSAALSSASLIPSSTRLHFQSPITLVLRCHEYCCHDELVATLYDDAKLETHILPLICSGAVTWQELQPIGRRALMDVVCFPATFGGPDRRW